eukprot:470553_1
MSWKTGSYCIRTLMEKMMENIENMGNEQFLAEIINEVQTDLHDDGKQLIDAAYNNKTGYIKFRKHHNETQFDDSHEITMKLYQNTSEIPLWTDVMCLTGYIHCIAPFLFAPDIAALVIHYMNDCNEALIKGSLGWFLDANAFIWGGCITHLVMCVLILCFRVCRCYKSISITTICCAIIC